MRILLLVLFVGGPAHPRARASVLSAPMQSHGMPLWGAHNSRPVASTVSAPLADPGASPMTVGWTGRFMPNNPHLAARVPPNTARAAWEKGQWQLRLQLRW